MSEVIENKRDRKLAKNSWEHCDSVYNGVDNPDHFKRGYIAGYMDKAAGGTGCPPMIPPKKYWGIHYQNASGKCKTVAWFDGYSHGALGAEMDGVDVLHRVPTASQYTHLLVPPEAEHEITEPQLLNEEAVPQIAPAPATELTNPPALGLPDLHGQ